jgi:asparagine synthetase B (glutamine-hydrolysing)
MGVDSSVIESLIPRQNPTLGRMLHSLLKEQSEESKTAETIAYATGIPHHLTLKLVLLGRACAGKRTVAK